MKIRRATIEDTGTLSRLNTYVQKLHATAYPDKFKLPEKDDFAVPFFTMLLEDPENHIYLAEDDTPIGYIFFQVRRQPENPFMYPLEYVQIDQIGVLPEYQGKGIGKALMAKAEYLADQEGLNMIGLDSWSFNTDAHEFFHSRGFQTFVLHMWKTN